ncbi:MAG TPA: hypothetical protein VLK33_06105 [Terriglobales bacterium]|nr:hypothetical protein [Terriglobales bacterium]
MLSDPQHLYDDACERLAQIPQEELFNSSAYQKLREQWCIGVLGIGYAQYVRPCTVGINHSSDHLDADAFMESQGVLYPFQIVETMKDGRKRGKEKKDLASGVIRSVSYEPEKGRIEGPNWIANMIAKKADKRYSGSTNLNLLVYANFDAHQLNYEDVRTKAEQFRTCFHSIWMILNTHICSLYSSDKLGSLPGWGEIDGVESI